MDKLGIHLDVILLQMLNFGILLFVLNKFLYKPILTMLEKRKKQIAESQKKVQDIDLEHQKAQKKRDEVLKDARSEAASMLALAKKEAKKLKEDMLVEARKEGEALKAKLEKDLKSRYEAMSKDLESETVDIAAKMVEKMLAGALSKDEQGKLIDRQLKKLKSMSK